MLNRRSLFHLFAPAAALALPSSATPRPVNEVDSWYPAQPSDRVREMVAVSHGNIKRVRELLALQPSLARASWDWGFGDWETALGAASHVGNREIAQFLIANGARPTIFSAAMLGQLDVVKAFVAASAGVQRIKGPHGITLLAHVRAGGPEAMPVLRYLESLGDADQVPAKAALTESEKSSLTGTYRFGPGTADVFEVSTDRGTLGIARRGGDKRGLTHTGSHSFFPAGAEAVQIRFSLEGSRATLLTIKDGDLMLTALRVPS